MRHDIKKTVTSTETIAPWKLALRPEARRRHSLAQISVLADDIAVDGLHDPITVIRVVANSDVYEIISGGRRYMAIRSLIEAGANVYDPGTGSVVPAASLYSEIPCQVISIPVPTG